MMPKEIRVIDVRELATFMHDKYEEQAKKVGWNTQEKCKVPFDKLPEANRSVMLNMALEVINWFNLKINGHPSQFGFYADNEDRIVGAYQNRGDVNEMTEEIEAMK